MRTDIRVAFLLLAVTAVIPPAVGEDVSFDDPEHWAAIWEAESRRDWQRPLAVLGLLGIEPGERVADLGAGTGYFTRLLAIETGATGLVYAVDIEPAMLRYIEGREDLLLRDRVRTVLATPSDPKLPAGGVDLIVTVNTWHHIDKRVRYIKKLQSALSDRGRVVVIDFRAGELPVGPPPREKISRNRVVREFRKAGWDFDAESYALRHQYVLTFSPPRDAPRPVWARR